MKDIAIAKGKANEAVEKMGETLEALEAFRQMNADLKQVNANLVKARDDEDLAVKSLEFARDTEWSNFFWTKKESYLWKIRDAVEIVTSMVNSAKHDTKTRSAAAEAIQMVLAHSMALQENVFTIAQTMGIDMKPFTEQHIMPDPFKESQSAKGDSATDLEKVAELRTRVNDMRAQTKAERVKAIKSASEKRLQAMKNRVEDIGKVLAHLEAMPTAMQDVLGYDMYSDEVVATTDKKPAKVVKGVVSQVESVVSQLRGMTLFWKHRNKIAVETQKGLQKAEESFMHVVDMDDEEVSVGLTLSANTRNRKMIDEGVKSMMAGITTIINASKEKNKDYTSRSPPSPRLGMIFGNIEDKMLEFWMLKLAEVCANVDVVKPAKVAEADFKAKANAMVIAIKHHRRELPDSRESMKRAQNDMKGAFNSMTEAVGIISAREAVLQDMKKLYGDGPPLGGTQTQVVGKIADESTELKKKWTAKLEQAETNWKKAESVATDLENPVLTEAVGTVLRLDPLDDSDKDVMEGI